MFGGFIENTGTLYSVQKQDEIRRIEVSASSLFTEKLIKGRSVAVNGVCLTVIDFDENAFLVECSSESWERTSFSFLSVGCRLNLELPLTLTTLLDGHLVQGHVDTTGEVISLSQRGKNLEAEVSYPASYASLVVEKGSVAIDGISLTCFQVGGSSFKVTLIPHTLAHTSFVDIAEGKRVNLEFDIIGKYLLRGERFKIKEGTNVKEDVTMESLLKAGFL